MKRRIYINAFPVRKQLTVLVILSMLIFFHGYQYGQEEPQRMNGKRGSIFENWMTDQMRIWSSPFKIKKKSLLFLGSVAFTTIYLIKKDKAFYSDIQEFTLTTQWAKKSSPVITSLGSNSLNLGFISTLYLGGLVFKDERAKKTARLSLRSLLHAIVVSEVLKRVFRRQRPYVENGIDRWFSPGDGNDFRSFPSGHATKVWSVATVIAGMYRDKPAIPIISYSLAALTALSRITEKKHWTSDIVVGAVLGYSIGRFVLRKHSHWLHIVPMLSQDKVGVSIYRAF